MSCDQGAMSTISATPGMLLKCARIDLKEFHLGIQIKSIYIINFTVDIKKKKSVQFHSNRYFASLKMDNSSV